MRKILILSIMAFGVTAHALEKNEEAMILNQELKYLEDSVNNIQAMSINTQDKEASRSRALNEDTLERTYFNETEEDTVSTRTAGPKRRSY